MSAMPAGPAEVRRDLLWLALGATLLFTVSLGARDLWNPNEPTYGQAVVEMHQRGDWLIPTINGKVFDEKPILYFWLALVAGKLFGGVNEWTLRFPAALSGIACVSLTYLLVVPYAGRFRARLSAGLLGTTYIVFWSARSVQMDVTLTACTLAAILSVMRAVDGRLSERRGWILFGLASGLGFLAKGPVGLLCPALVVLVYLVATRRLARLRSIAPLLGMTAFVLVLVPWILWLVSRGQVDFLVEALLRQNLGRVLQPWDHQAPWWYFLYYFWIDMAPWSFFAPLALGLAGRDADQRRLDLLALLWIVVLVGFFSFSPSKRSPYILPVAPAVAVLASSALTRWISAGLDLWRRQVFFVVLAFFVLLQLGAAGYLYFVALEHYPSLAASGRATAILFLAGALGLLSSLAFGERARVAAASALLAFVVSLYVLAAVWVLPEIDRYKSPRGFASEVLAHVGAEGELRSYRLWPWRAGYRFYLGRPIGSVASLVELEEYWQQEGPVFLIVERGRLAEVQPVLGDAVPLVNRKIGANQAFLFANRPGSI